MRRLLRSLLRALVGMFMCTSPLLSVLVVGWTQRAMRRTALREWHRMAAAGSFAEFARGAPETVG